MVNGAPYPFGYGLSYTTFAYSNLTVTPAVQTPGGTIEVSVDVENTGDRAGDEIVQLYLSPRLTSVVYYDKVLPGFMRVPLKAREKTRVPFTRKPSDLQTLGRDNAMEG